MDRSLEMILGEARVDRSYEELVDFTEVHCHMTPYEKNLGQTDLGAIISFRMGHMHR